MGLLRAISLHVAGRTLCAASPRVIGYETDSAEALFLGYSRRMFRYKRLSTSAIFLMTLCTTLAAGVHGQKESSRIEGPEHFRWSEAKAHEIDHNHTIKSASDLTPKQKNELIEAVLKQLKSHKSLNEFFQDMSNLQLRDLAASTRVELVDLNGDGRPEVIAQANGLGPCGETGNCIFWIFQLNSGGVKLLLDSFDSEAGFDVITVRPWSTNGFRDLVLGAHINASDRDLVWYKYAKGRYGRWKCYYSSSQTEKSEPLKSSVIRPFNCTEMFTPDKPEK